MHFFQSPRSRQGWKITFVSLHSPNYIMRNIWYGQSPEVNKLPGASDDAAYIYM